MSEQTEQNTPASPEAPREHPAMGQIVGNLKDYPFLLITVAGLLILSGILIFDLEKLKEFKWLIYGVVLVPLIIQFFIEYQKIASLRARERAATVAPSTSTAQPMPATTLAQTPAKALPVSTKALWSLGLLIMILLALNETSAEEFQDRDLMLGYLAFAGAAGVLAWFALGEVKQQRARGKALAIIELVFATLIALSAIGWLTDTAPAPESASFDSESLLQPNIQDVQVPDGSEEILAAISTIENSAPSDASLNPPAAVTLAGQYVLREFTVGGMPVDLNGALNISRADSNTYDWQSHYAGQGPEGVATESYSGQLLRRAGLWYQRVTETDVAEWDGPEEVLMQLTHDGTNLQLRYSYGAAEIVSTWQRDVE